MPQRQRPHRPEELGSRIYRRGRWFYIDLRWLGGTRTVMRNPAAPGWPALGSRTSDQATAREWRPAYEKHWSDAQTSAQERASGSYSTLRAAADAWLRHRAVQNAESTASGSRTALTHLMEHVGEGVHPASVTSAQLQELWDDFLHQGYGSRSVASTRHHVSKFYTWLGTNPNPASATKVPRKPHEDVRPWSAHERQKIRDAADALDSLAGGRGIPRRRLVEMLFGMGLRIQEAAAGQWEWISRRARTVRVVEQIARKSNQPKRLKDSKARTAVVLQEWWDHHLDGATGLIVADEAGRPVRHRRLHDHVVEILVAAGVKQPGKAAHQFRHTYAFLFLQRGGSMEQLQKALGHAKISTTQEYYDHFTSDHAARAGVRAIYRARRGPRS